MKEPTKVYTNRNRQNNKGFKNTADDKKASARQFQLIGALYRSCVDFCEKDNRSSILLSFSFFAVSTSFFFCFNRWNLMMKIGVS